MKRILFALFLLVPAIAMAYDFKIVNGNVVFAVWKATKNGVTYVAYSNAERNAFIAASPSSAALVTGDFADISPDAAQTVSANQIEPVACPEEVVTQLDKLSTKVGVIELVDLLEDRIARLQRLNQRYGFNVAAATTTAQNRVDAIRARYAGAQ